MSDEDDASQQGIEQFDLTTGMDFDTTPGDIWAVVNDLKEAEDFDVEAADAEQLADYAAALKALEDAAEDARKEIFESELDERVETGETVGDLRRTPGSRRYVTDDAAAFDAVLDAGHDPRDVASVSASKLADVLGEDADEFIGETTYTYYRRDA